VSRIRGLAVLWLTSTRWTPAHTDALITGAWPAHALLSHFVMPLGTADRAALALIMLGEAGLGIWLIGRGPRYELERLTMQVSDPVQ
jgi:hypothetical protein